MTQTCMRI